MRRVTRSVVAAFLVAFALRLGYVLALPARLRFPDEHVYVTVARNFRAGDGFVQEPGQREASKAPGYPFILALCNPEGGLRGFLLRVRVLQSFVEALACVFIWLLTRRVFSDRAGIAAMWMAAIYPFFIYFCGLLLSETLFIAAFLVGVLLLDMADEEGIGGADQPLTRRRLYAATCAGFAFGIATLVRASALLFLPFFLPFWLMKRAMISHPRAGVPQKIEVAQPPTAGTILGLFAACMLAFAFTQAPWITRNYAKFHAFVPTTLQTGESLYEGNSPYATGGPAWHLVDWQKESGGRVMDELENDRFWKSKATEWMKSHPKEFFKLAAIKLGRFWNPAPNYEGMLTPFYVIVSVLSYAPVMALGLCGLWMSLKRWRRVLILLAPVLYYACLHMVFVGSIRYRTPVMPFIMAFSGCGLVLLVCALRRNDSPVS